MSGSLIIYSSTDGHTRNICKRILNILNGEEAVQLTSLDNIKQFEISEYNKIMIGASIRYGKYSNELYKFVEKNKEILKQKKTFFFSVNVVARKPGKNTPDTNPYIKKFLKISKWRPNKIEVFAGKVDYPKYKFLDKYMIKLIMFITGGPTDTSQSYEFTNWLKVDEFAKQLKFG